MAWKKSWFSYFLWGFVSILVCLTFVLGSSTCLIQYGQPVYLLFLPLGITIIVYLIVKLYKNKFYPVILSGPFLVTLESLVFVSLLAGGLLVRLYSVSDISGTEIFQNAMIMEENSRFQTYHGALGFYLYVLRTIFYFIGNSWMGAIAFQIGIQLIGFSLLYFIIRKTTGICAAFTSFCLFMFAPKSIELAVTLSPTVLYFLLCVLVLYFVSESTNRILENQKVYVYQYFTAILAGILGGLIIYLDIIGLFLILLSLLMFFLQKKNSSCEKISGKALYFIFFIISVLIGFALAVYVDCGLKAESSLLAFQNWEWLFSPSLGQSLYTYVEFPTDVWNWVYLAVLFFVLLLGIYGYFENKKYTPSLGWALTLLFLVAFNYNCPATSGMERAYFISVFLAIYAGSGIEALLSTNIEDEEMQLHELVEQNEDVTEICQESLQEEILESVQDKKEIQYIPNPLPLPKKHVKKSIGFGIEVEDEKMCFDIEVSEEDDFDL